jgi:hypothetical protein
MIIVPVLAGVFGISGMITRMGMETVREEVRVANRLNETLRNDIEGYRSAIRGLQRDSDELHNFIDCYYDALDSVHKEWFKKFEEELYSEEGDSD